eukprot:566442-Pelagomonas_calceolata.AAC.13
MPSQAKGERCLGGTGTSLVLLAGSYIRACRLSTFLQVDQLGGGSVRLDGQYAGGVTAKEEVEQKAHCGNLDVSGLD